MSLRFVWLIFRKDTRRLWWMIALTVALLARLACLDSLRNNDTPSAEEGWLYILLPFVWSFLIALAAMEDSAVDSAAGESPFWVTVPCRCPSILAAKILFLAAFVHVPYLLAVAYIVQAHGFVPADCLGALMGKQVAVLAVTLGALALATVVRNVTQFMMIALALTAAVGAPIWVNDGNATLEVRELVIFPIVILAALGVAISQYARGRSNGGTLAARAAGIAAILLAFVIWWLPGEIFYGLQAALSPATRPLEPVVRLSDSLTPFHGFPPSRDYRLVGIPIAIAQTPGSFPFRVIQSWLSLEDGQGHRYGGHTNRLGDSSGPVRVMLCCRVPVRELRCCEEGLPGWQVLGVDHDLFARMGNSSLRLKGSLLVKYYHLPDPVSVPVGATVAIPGMGKCFSEVGGEGGHPYLHVGCVSLATIPTVKVTVTDPVSGRFWAEPLENAARFVDTTRSTWLSPLHRGDTFYPVADEQGYASPSGWRQVPREIIPTATITITPEVSEGSKVVNYAIPNLRLSQYAVKEGR